MELFSLFGNIDIKDNEATSKLDKIDKKAEGTGGKFDKMKDITKKAGKVMAVGVGAAATAMVGMAKKAADTGDEIHKGSQRMGISTDAYQELDYWAGQNGMSQADLEKGVGRLNTRLGEAAAGNEKYAGALEKLGVPMDAVREGTISTEEAFATSIQSLSEMENEQEKAALASELFGSKLAREMLPALNDSSLSIEDATAMAHEMGIVMGEDAVNGAADLSDMMDNAQRSFGAIFREIGEKVMPIMLEFLEWVVDHMPQIQEIIGTVFDAVIVIIDAVVNVFRNYLIPVFDFLVDVVQENMPLIQSVIDTVFGTVKELITAFVGLVMAIWERWGTQITAVVKVAFNLVRTIVSTGVNAVKAVIEIVMGIITGDWGRAWNGIKSLVSGVWDGIKSYITIAINAVKSVMTTVFDSIKTTTTNVWDGIKTAMTNPIETAKNTISGIIDTIKGFFSNLRLKFPKIEMPKLPKFELTGKFGLKPPSVPKLGVSWNADGGIFNKATLFNTANAGLQGVGEAGSEAIIPLNKKTLGGIGDGIASTMSGNNNGEYNFSINIEQFNNHTKQDVEKLSEDLAFQIRRKLAGEGLSFG